MTQLLLPISAEIICVEKRINRLIKVNGFISDSDLARYIIGGKHLRAAIVLLIGKMFNVEMEPFHRLSSSIEMLHSATLAHDDLVDGGSIRRNHATSSSHTFPVSLLVGDYLLAQSTSELASLEDPSLMKIHSNILLAVCGGEYQQWYLSGKSVSRQTYFDIIEKKTASLFAGAAEMAAVLSGTDSETRANLREYGLEIGTLYQLVDDVLDFIGDEAVLGKTLRQDLRRGTFTLPTILYQEIQHEDPIPPSGDLSDSQLSIFVEKLRKSGAIDAALGEAELYASSCKKSLLGLPEGMPCRTLESLADFILDQAKNPQC